MESPIFAFEVPFDEYIQDGSKLRPTKFTDLPAIINPIPTDTIIYKTVTGLGATYSEIVADRNSIIVLPNISIIKNKQLDHQERHNTFAIWNEISKEKVLNHLQSTSKLKFLTTPEGLKKIQWAEKKMGRDIYKHYFILIDECQKIIRDGDFRDDMLPSMDEFFQFEKKAMVSATPINPSDPRFVSNGFKNIRVKPTFPYKKEIKLIHSNGIINPLKEIFHNNSNEVFYIFFNSIQGIQSIMDVCSIEDESTLFCSKENENLLSVESKFKVSSEFTNQLAKKFNFFTSSFYNGLDIIIETPPIVIILSDVGFADFSMVDPATDVLQILGRLRKGYKEAIHINNSKKWTSPITEEVALERISISKKTYEFCKTMEHSYTGGPNDTYIQQHLERQRPYSNLLDREKKYSYFKGDNYLYENLVSSYYINARALKSAYDRTDLYIVKEEKQQIEKIAIEHLSRGKKKYSKENVKAITDVLRKLEAILGTEEHERYLANIKQLYQKVYDAYFELGEDVINEHQYDIKKIYREIIYNDIIKKKNDSAIIEVIYDTFYLNIFYTSAKIKPLLQEIYDDFEILEPATATDLEYYFEPHPTKRKHKGERGYLFLDWKFNILEKYRRN